MTRRLHARTSCDRAKHEMLLQSQSRTEILRSLRPYLMLLLITSPLYLFAYEGLVALLASLAGLHAPFGSSRVVASACIAGPFLLVIGGLLYVGFLLTRLGRYEIELDQHVLRVRAMSAWAGLVEGAWQLQDIERVVFGEPMTTWARAGRFADVMRGHSGGRFRIFLKAGKCHTFFWMNSAFTGERLVELGQALAQRGTEVAFAS